LKNKLVYIFIYFPSLFIVTIFGLANSANDRYKLIRTEAGWINVSENKWEDWFYNIYFISITIIVIWMILDWGIKSKDLKKKKQAYTILASFGIASIGGTMTEIVLNAYTSYTVPQIAPIIAILPIMAVLYSYRRYGLMNSNKNSITEPGKILSDATLVKLYNFMSIVFIFGGLLCFVALYFFYSVKLHINYVLLYSFSFFLIGAILYIINRSPVKSDIKELLLVTIVAIPILITTFVFMDNANITVWAIPVIAVMMCVLFSKRRIIIELGIFIFVTQIFVWLRVPNKMVHIGGSDYLTRMGIYCIILWLAFYINKLYKCRLEENEAQI
ncbi:MAG: hypothetical protein GX660_14820, partial [Clostridiaceae bacterium]|nr:hypothetical protein [Clostridiaceae bacterium]